MTGSLDFVAVPSQDAARAELAFFTNLDGNDLMLHHRYAPRQ